MILRFPYPQVIMKDRWLTFEEMGTTRLHSFYSTQHGKGEHNSQRPTETQRARARGRHISSIEESWYHRRQNDHLPGTYIVINKKYGGKLLADDSRHLYRQDDRSLVS